MTKPKLQPSAETIAYLKDLWALFMEPKDAEFLETLLTRNDKQNGAEQVKDITELCEKSTDLPYERTDFLGGTFGASKKVKKRVVRDTITPFQMHLVKQRIEELLWSARISSYRQRFVAVCVAQRKQHPKHAMPSLGNMLPPQSCRIEALTCYGLGYAEARNHLVKSALSQSSVTHVLFLDDDVLVPSDGISKLLEVMAKTGIKILGGIYVKKAPNLESVVTTSVDDPELIYGNASVPAVQGDMEPALVGCTGLGFTLVEASVFRSMPEPWFQFVQEEGSRRVVIGEDSFFIQKCAFGGIQAAVLPGVVGVHVDFATGRHYGPEWVVDPVTQRLRPELVEHYTQFPDDIELKELLADDVEDLFGKNKRAGIAALKAVTA